MQSFTTLPSAAKNLTYAFVRADGTPGGGFSAPITWTIDQPSLAQVQTGWPGAQPSQIRVVPTLPAAADGGTVNVTGSFVNENGVTATTTFQVVIAANPNPVAGLLFS